MASVHQALIAFGCSPDHVVCHDLGNAGGMSGARLWRVESDAAARCLRRWPRPHPDHDRLCWIHRLMQQARAAGCHFVPALHLAPDGTSVVALDGHLWELTDWVTGSADFADQPSTNKLTSAMQCLAQFHLALASDDSARHDHAPGISERLRLLQDAPQRDQLARWRQQIHDDLHGPMIAELCRNTLERLPERLVTCEPLLRTAATRRTAIQPCLRDIWHDHVLFTDHRVTGFVDFGAMRIDSPLVDLARLLGSLVPDDPDAWAMALTAYGERRPLGAEATMLLAALDSANTPLSALNWIRWLYIERRQFEDSSSVTRRLTAIQSRLGAHVRGKKPYDI